MVGVSYPRLSSPKASSCHLIGHDLVIRVLLDKANPHTLYPLVQGIKRLPFKQDSAHPCAMRRKNRFKLPQERGFATARGTAQAHKFSLSYGKRHIGQCFFALFRIGKIEIVYFKCIGRLQRDNPPFRRVSFCRATTRSRSTRLAQLSSCVKNFGEIRSITPAIDGSVHG